METHTKNRTKGLGKLGWFKSGKLGWFKSSDINDGINNEMMHSKKNQADNKTTTKKTNKKQQRKHTHTHILAIKCNTRTKVGICHAQQSAEYFPPTLLIPYFQSNIVFSVNQIILIQKTSNRKLILCCTANLKTTAKILYKMPAQIPKGLS